MRSTTHKCYFCGKSISKSVLVFEEYDGFRQPCHRNCWRNAKHEAESDPKSAVKGQQSPLKPVSPGTQAPPVPPKPGPQVPLVPRNPESLKATEVIDVGFKFKTPKPQLKAVHRSHGWYDVMDADGNKINPTPVRKKAAEAFVNEANQGKATP